MNYYMLALFSLERVVINAPIIALVGGGAFLLFGRGKYRGSGIFMLVLYAMSAFGSHYEHVKFHNGPGLNNNEIEQVATDIVAVLSLAIGAFWGNHHRRKREAAAVQVGPL